jgi:uncharacterized protein YjbI with pentapeptide repeats
MANSKHLAILKKGVKAWNQWRDKSLIQWLDMFYAAEAAGRRPPSSQLPDLRGANLSMASLRGANLSGANLSRANLQGADLGGANLLDVNLSSASLCGAYLREAILMRANLRDAKLIGARLTRANLRLANLTKANLSGAQLGRADLSETDLRWAVLSGAKLERAILVDTKLGNANLTGCSVYGISAWNLSLKGAIQSNLVITPRNESVIQVDNLEVAQFIYLLLNNKKIRDVIDTIGKKAVLILGRFTKQRKVVLDAIREKLRECDYLPILFDFEKPASRDLTETISTLAHMARFVIADITDAKSIPQELMKIVPTLPSVPVQPLLLASKREWAMFGDLRRYPWVLAPFCYKNPKALLAELEGKVIAPAEAKAGEQTRK